MKLSINSSSPPNLLTKEQLKSIYLKLFSGEDGKIVLEDLAQMSGIYRSNFVRQESDYTAFLEGHRALFLYICSQASEDDGVNNIDGAKMNQINKGNI
ncbi:hypothetical protein [Candidatus Tisiphia endosymbiont of Xenochironomus xenolabis]|uniref:Bbp19 family protein n=1 Tax=unclassified Candidatus Tisiphia TaxID=2996318 RepID=UPI0035C8BBA2